MSYALTEVERMHLAALEMRYIAQNRAYFLDEYIYFEDKDNPEAGGIVKLEMWPMQREAFAIMESERLNIILKARQLGLTWLTLAYIVHDMLCFPGFEALGISKTDDDSMELCRRVDFMLRHLPSWMIQERDKSNKNFPLTYDYTKHEVTIFRPDGESSRFKVKSAAPDSGRSFTGNVLMLDEFAATEAAAEIWKAAFLSINRPDAGKVFIISTAKRGTFFHTMWNNAMIYGLNRIFLPWYANPKRNQKWYEATKAALLDGHAYLQEVPATAEEAFAAGEGVAFPEFSMDVHVCKPFKIPAHWRRWMSCDNGFADPFAWHWYAVSEDGQVFVYREYTRTKDETRVYYTEQGKEVDRLSVVDDKAEVVEKEKIEYIVAGLDAWNRHHRDQSGKTLLDYYYEGGLSKYTFVKAVADRRAQKATIHEYLRPFESIDASGLPVMTAKVQIFETCSQLIKTLGILEEDPLDSEKVADSPLDHWKDSFGYGLMSHHAATTKSLPKTSGEVKLIKDAMVKKHLKNNRRYRKWAGCH